jgi:hypothetical protein
MNGLARMVYRWRNRESATQLFWVSNARPKYFTEDPPGTVRIFNARRQLVAEYSGVSDNSQRPALDKMWPSALNPSQT